MSATLRTAFLCLSLALATEGASSAQTAEDKSSAKKALEEANKLSQKGDLQAALVQYRAAFAFAPTPVTGLMLGKALTRLGKLVEARETYATVEAMPKKASESKASDDARQEAGRLKLEVTERIPLVTLIVEGAEPGATPTVTLDDRDVPAATLGVERRLDPGAHVLTAKTPNAPEVKRTFSLVERQRLELKVRLEPKAEAPKAATEPADPRPAGGPGAPKAEPTGKADEPGTPTKVVTAFPWKTTALIASGVGLAVSGVGAYLYFEGANTKSDLASQGCTRDVCLDAAQRSSFQTADGQAKNGTAMLIGGGALFAAGLLTFFIAPSPTGASASARIEAVRVGSDRLELVGRF